jgi:hypothetical protein
VAEQLTIVRANEASCDDLAAIFGTTDYPGRCQCQRFKVVGWFWRDGALGRVMATRYRSSRFVSDKLLNRAAALEALDRDTHSQDDLSFKQRMLRLAALAGDRFLDAIDDAESWATRFKDARVAAAHHSDRHADDAGHLDYYLAEVAYFLFVCCFLRLIEANDETLGRVTNDRHFTHAAQVLRQEA